MAIYAGGQLNLSDWGVTPGSGDGTDYPAGEELQPRGPVFSESPVWVSGWSFKVFELTHRPGWNATNPVSNPPDTPCRAGMATRRWAGNVGFSDGGVRSAQVEGTARPCQALRSTLIEHFAKNNRFARFYPRHPWGYPLYCFA